MSATSPQQPRRIAYLVNLYPKTSHAWMRREIAAMAAAGVAVERFSVRRVDEPLVDPEDLAEAEKTLMLLDGGALAALPRALLAVGIVAVTRPVRLLKAAALAFHVAVGHPKGLLFQLFYLAEACLFLRMLAGRDVGHAVSYTHLTLPTICSV